MVEKSELNEEFFLNVYPHKAITTETDFRAEVKAEIEHHFSLQSKNQVYDQVYHHLTDHTPMEFPESFLKRWLQNGGEKAKTAEEAEKDYPDFVTQLKWTLVSSKLLFGKISQVIG